MKSKPVQWFYVLVDDHGKPIGDSYHTRLTCSKLARSKRRVRSHKSSTPPATDKCNECKKATKK